jgi:hypothetical protein
MEAAARRLHDEGSFEAASELWKAAADIRAALQGLQAIDPSGNLQQMTGAQLERRGKAIAKGHAAKSGDPLWKAITASKWGSQERYARDRLGVSPGSLSAYRSGATPCPRSVAQRIEKDLGVGLDYWTAPRSLTD